MPLRIHVDVDAGFLRAEGSGHLSLQDLQEALAAIVEHPDFTPGMPQLCDLSDVEDVDLTYGDLKAVVEWAMGRAERLGRSKVALVASEPVVFGVSRMYGVLAQDLPTDIRVFRTREDALRWLGVG